MVNHRNLEENKQESQSFMPLLENFLLFNRIPERLIDRIHEPKMVSTIGPFGSKACKIPTMMAKRSVNRIGASRKKNLMKDEKALLDDEQAF